MELDLGFCVDEIQEFTSKRITLFSGCNRFNTQRV